MEAIQLFYDVAQHQSVSRAAEAHGVTQSAVSQRIATLEKELGVLLIDRSKRPLQLTHAGEIFQVGCRDILDRFYELKLQIAPDAPSANGTIRVAAIYSAGIDLLNQAVERFSARHPHAHIEVQYHQPHVVYEKVQLERVDFGIISFPGKWRDLVSKPLRDEIMVVTCRANHPLAQRRTVRATELAEHELVLFERSLPIGRRMLAYFRQHGVKPRIAHTFDNIDTLKVYLAHSHEVAILPERTVMREVAAGTLAIARLEPRLTRPIAIVHPRGRTLAPTAELFVDALLKTTPTPPMTDLATNGATANA